MICTCIKAVLNLYKEAIRKWARRRAASQGKFCSSEGTTSFIHVSKQCSIQEKWALCLWGSQQSGLTDLFNLMPGLWTESTQNKQDQFPASPAPSTPAQPTPCPQILFSLAGCKVHDNSSKGLILKKWRGKKSCQTGKTVGWKKRDILRYVIDTKKALFK